MNDRAESEIVYRAPSRRACNEHALVLAAAGIPFNVRRDWPDLVLMVSADDADRAKEELAGYAEDDRKWRIEHAAEVRRGGGGRGIVAYFFVLMLIRYFEQNDAWGFDWLGAGRAHADSIRDGQWWRVITALTLHADPPHLVSNLIIGGLFGLFAGQLLGGGLAWLTILTAGAAGNWINAWIRPPMQSSIGASTAVFACLGLVAAMSFMQRRRASRSLMVRAIPLIGAMALLGFLGSGGERTDVTAHATGFGSGVLLGLLYGWWGYRFRLGQTSQTVLGALTAGMIALSWILALRS